MKEREKYKGEKMDKGEEGCPGPTRGHIHLSIDRYSYLYSERVARRLYW